MDNERCFVFDCKRQVKCGTEKVFSCEEHEDIFYTDFVKPYEVRQ